MDTEELKKFITEESKKIFELQGGNTVNNDLHLLLRMAKVQEEAGELADALLDHLGHQRKDKTDAAKSDIGEELADLIITVLLVAETMGVDTWQALSKKIEKIKQRH